MTLTESGNINRRVKESVILFLYYERHGEPSAQKTAIESLNLYDNACGEYIINSEFQTKVDTLTFSIMHIIKQEMTL